jgi:hypothetical protein
MSQGHWLSNVPGSIARCAYVALFHGARSVVFYSRKCRRSDDCSLNLQGTAGAQVCVGQCLVLGCWPCRQPGVWQVVVTAAVRAQIASWAEWCAGTLFVLCAEGAAAASWERGSAVKNTSGRHCPGIRGVLWLDTWGICLRKQRLLCCVSTGCCSRCMGTNSCALR